MRRFSGRFAPRALGWQLVLGCLCSTALLPLGLLVEGCASTDETSGKRVVLHTRVELTPADEARFTTAVGWTVSLSRAAIATGPLYYFDGTPPLVFRERPWSSKLAARFFGIGTAQAHPGHYEAGNALGQMLEAYSVDLLAGPADFPDGDGVSGVYRSARFSFGTPPVGPAESVLDGHAAVAEGTATKDGETTYFFRAFADLADIEQSAAEGQVNGCEFSEQDVQADGTVTVTVNPAVWFNLVDFAELDTGSEDEPVEFPADSQPKLAFAQGLTQLSAYKFSYSTP